MNIKYAKLGSNKNNGRIWLEGNNLTAAGFSEGTPYRRVDNVEGRQIALFTELATDTDRKVTASKRNGKSRPIIDLNDSTITEIFGNTPRVRVEFSQGRIVITAHHEDVKKEAREADFKRNYKGGMLREASLFTGGAVSTEAIHQALAEADLVKGGCKWVCEIEQKYIESAQDNAFCVDDNTAVIIGSVEEVEAQYFTGVDVLSFSMPCAGFSKAGKVKHKQTSEAHSGTTLFGTMTAIKAANPAILISENVAEAQNSPIYQLLRGELTRMGYTIFEQILDGTHTGSIEQRKRYWMVAISSGIAPESFELPTVASNTTPISAIIEADAQGWSMNEGLKAKAVRDAAAGKGFAKRQLLTGDETTCGTIGRFYAKNRSTEPHIVRPDGMERLFTPTEHAKVKSAPPHLIANQVKTTAHEILGQAVDYLQPYNLTRALIGAINH